MNVIGEIIETTSTAIIAESNAVNQAPALGSLCEMNSADGLTLFAVVSFGRTGGFDPGRRAVRRGQGAAVDAEVYKNSPELNRILRTEFSAVLAGWRNGAGEIRQRIPPQPPPLHYSVRACDAATVAAFSESLGYLRLLLASVGDLSPDQLVAANIRAVYAARGEDYKWLERAGREVASLLKNDYERLMTVLQAIEP